MTYHDAALQRQLELEIEMAGLGADKFTARINKAREKGRGGTENPGSYIVSTSIRPLSEAITRFVEDTFNGSPGRHPVAAKLLRDMDPGVVAYLSSRAILNGLMWKGRSGLLGLAREVSRAVEAEARFATFERQAPGLYATVQRDLKEKGSTENHQIIVMAYAMNKFDIPWDVWSKADKQHLGIKLVELFCEVTGAAELSLEQTTFTGKFKEQYFVTLTASTQDWINQSMQRGEKRWPEYLPTLIPPKDWDGLSGGGYHSNAVRPLDLVKKIKPVHRKLLAEAHLEKVFQGLNAIQRTPWPVNRDVFEVMQKLHITGSEIGGLVRGREHDLPERPVDIDTNAQALKEWKWAARDVRLTNIQLRRDRLQQQSLVDLAKRFRDEPAIYFPHNLDFRGRAYPVPLLLHPQGSDQVKALLRFAEGKPLGGVEGGRWLMVHGANTYGVDKVSFAKRVEWVEENWRHIVRSAHDPLGYLWWTEADKPWCFLAFCFEYRDWVDAGCGADFVSHLPIALDGSCNGLQHFSAMLLDPIGGAAVNLLPAEKPQDIYQVVADHVIAELRLVRPANRAILEEGGKGPTDAQKVRWAHEWLHFGIDRKVTKRPVMVLPYGGTPRSCVKYVEEEVTRRIKEGQPHNFGDELKPAIAWLSSLVWQSIGEVVVAARDAMAWLQKTARVVSRDGIPIRWTTPSGFVAWQANMDFSHRRIKSKVAGTLVYLLQKEETDEINRSKQATSISPNFVHSLDASAMILTVALLAARGLSSFAMIHDSYATHACNTTLLAATLRQVFIELYEVDPLTLFRDEVVEYVTPERVEELTPLPGKGTLDLKEIANSDFFFA